jgi:RNA polymerase sigma factor (sigma-70 family)
VLRLLETLPDLHRKMIQLREEEELSYAEIAGVLNITESKVKSDLFRIRQYLKQAFEKVNSYGLRNDK